MPFPLAHPAAVMPLRRYCPRWLSLPALMIGSLTPDAGYLFGEGRGGAFSHTPVGTVLFCLPAGILLVAMFYWLRGPVMKLLPPHYRRALLPLCQRGRASPWTIVLSLLIGAWTHLLWDSFTHTNGWFPQHMLLLQRQVASIGIYRVRVCHLLWYGFSFAGVVWLFAVFEKWKQIAAGEGPHPRSWSVIRDAVLVAVAAVPIELMHHMVRLNKLGLCLLAMASGLLMLVILLAVADVRRWPAPEPPQDPKAE
jgi:hypothetical protein